MQRCCGLRVPATRNSRELTETVFNGEMGWLPWQRPGYDLGLKLEQVAQDNPDIKSIMLEGHGIFTWGAGSKECYENTLDIICSDQLIPDIKLNGFSAFAGDTARTPMR